MPGQADPLRRDVSASARRPALVVAICFICGIAAHRVCLHYPQIWLSLAVVFAAVASLLFHRALLSSILLMLATLVAGVAIAQIEAFYYPSDDISGYATDEPRLAWLELEVNHEPRVLTDPFSARPLPPKQVMTAAIKRVKTWAGWLDCGGDILVQ